MKPARYVRIPHGALIVSRMQLQTVVAHLRDLSRHVESLIPDEDDMLEKLARSRDFSGGFAQRKQYEQELERAVLEALAERRDGHAYEALLVEGYSPEQIASAVQVLWKAGMVDAHGGKPSTLTTKGYRKLQKIAKAEKVGA